MISETLLWALGTPAWLVGGGITTKQALAQAERYYIKLSHEAHQKDPRNKPQETMDQDDWIGASLWGAGAFMVWPVIAVIWGLWKFPFKFIYGKFRSFVLPPKQKAFEVKWEGINKQKALVLATAEQYKEVWEWDPKDDPNRQMLLEQYQTQVQDQMRDLMKMLDPNNPSGRDMDYLQAAKTEVKALTSGGY